MKTSEIPCIAALIGSNMVQVYNGKPTFQTTELPNVVMIRGENVCWTSKSLTLLIA
jgi:hypothetical protein